MGRDPVKQRANQKRYREAHPDKVRDARRASEIAHPGAIRARYLRRVYGLSVLAWLYLFVSQGYRCAVCGAGESESMKGWHTDHDHSKPGTVRAIVCHHCNTMLGAARDNESTLIKGASYLARHR